MDESVIIVSYQPPIPTVDLTNETTTFQELEELFSLNSTPDKPVESDENQTSSRKESFSLQCTVCLDNCVKKEPTATKCGHIFCKLCIEMCVELTEKCPLCNKRVNINEIFRLYF